MNKVGSDFAALHIEPGYVARLKELGMETPTPVQAEAIPVILEGKDTVVQSQTGSGKTLAYALPLLQAADPAQKHVQAMVLAPTRELGMQIVRTFQSLTDGTGIRVQQLIGGASIQRQIEALKKKPHIVVGTPGRILELLKLRKLSLHGVRQLVVDEVDQVLELGGLKETETILRGLRRDKQVLFFSATIPPRIMEAVERWMQDPAFVRINPAERTSPTIEHYYVVSEERDKLDTLRRLVRTYNPKAAIVFIGDTEDIGETVAKLRFIGLSVEGLYGDAFKLDRVQAMQRFRDGKVQLLLATDVAARGLDLPNVTHVIHLDPATDADAYVHRTGRTGRMGRRGTAFSIVTPKEEFIMDKFSKALGIRIERRTLYYGKVLSPEEEEQLRRGRGKKPVKASASASAVRPPGAGLERPAAGGALAGTRAPQAGALAGPSTAARPGSAGPAAGRRSAAGGSPATRQQGSAAGSRVARKQSAAGSGPASRKQRKPLTPEERKNKGAPRWLKAKREQT
ncbi:DEAD/DEAH box helicase [Paenibacillus ginsengihumi]|uniref:DEAD/DEAH box helicase n=1 Tax=Paenibacillus ginsengihumi TaxID=431596 RepID=UPI000364A2FA|nr:DEAD/DEAH box helicase [Paenibacillus ginsengihumi]